MTHKCYDVRIDGVDYLLTTDHQQSKYGKPILTLGGVAAIRPEHLKRRTIEAGTDEAVAILNREGFILIDGRPKGDEGRG